MADVAEDNKIVDATPVDEVKEAVKEVLKVPEKEVTEVAAEAVPAETAETAEETKEVENGNTEEAPKENGTAKDGEKENGNANGNEVEEDVERKRKSDVAGDEADGAPTAEGVSAEKKAKLEEKSEEGGVTETPSNGDSGVVA